MDKVRFEEIKNQLQYKSIKELNRILKERNYDEWTEDAFQVIEMLLQERKNESLEILEGKIPDEPVDDRSKDPLWGSNILTFLFIIVILAINWPYGSKENILYQFGYSFGSSLVLILVSVLGAWFINRKKTMSTIKKINIGFFCAIILSIILAFPHSVIDRGKNQSDEHISESSLNKNLLEASNKINKHCPIMINKDSKLDTTLVLPGRILEYKITLINHKVEEINTGELKKTLSLQLKNYAKTNPNMEELRKNKVTLIYYYSDKNGKYVTRIKISPEDYK
ncbi:MAG: hypothetical protein PVH61_42415 [Candidatus Aminicenantes bacterium]|jgi:hypothetical protein